MSEPRAPRDVVPVVLPPLIVLGLLVLVWQLVALSRPNWIPTLGAIGSSIAANRTSLLEATGFTLAEAMVGLAFAFVVAFLIAVAVSEARVVERAVMPVAVLLYVTPIVALTPGIGLVFGFGMPTKYVVTALVVFFPFLVNAVNGLKAIDAEALEVFESLAASRWEILWRLRLPASIPSLMTGARIAVPLSLVGAVVAGFASSSVGNVGGLGAYLTSAAENSALGEEYAAVLFLAVLGIALSAIVAVLERKLVPWRDLGGATAR